MLDETDPTTPEGDDTSETSGSGPEASGSGTTQPVSLVEEALRASSEGGSDGAPDDQATDQPADQPGEQPEAAPPAKKTAAKRTATKRAPRKTAAVKAAEAAAAAESDAPAEPREPAEPGEPAESGEPVPAKKATARKTTARKTAAKKTTRATTRRTTKTADPQPDQTPDPEIETGTGTGTEIDTGPVRSTAVLFQAPERIETSAPSADTEPEEEPQPEGESAEETGKPDRPEKAEKAEKSGKKSGGKGKKSGKKKAAAKDVEESESPEAEPTEAESGAADQPDEAGDGSEESTEEVGEDGGARRRGRRRGGRRRRRGASGDSADGSDANDRSDASQDDSGEDSEAGPGSDQRSDSDEDATDGQTDGGGTGSRRRRRRRRSGSGGGNGGNGGGGSSDAGDDRSPEDQITSLSGSTRLEAKKQRRREGREAGRRRAPIVSEAEFLARRESVERVMAIRQRDDLTQIAVLEDKVLVEHYVARESQTSLIGNVYLGRVQNVLPSMEAAFIDIGKGRNAVLYAGEVNWKALGAVDGQPRKIESVLKSGQTVLVQVTKDPIGHKGARLTSQISLPGRFLVYVPDGTTSGISRKLPEGERNRLKTLLKQIVPASAGVIVRTAAEGASEEELTHDVERLTARWTDIEAKVASGRAPALLYGEPDLTLKVVRDLFTEDFTRLVVQGDDAWDLVDGYVGHVAPDLRERLERHPGDADGDLFASYRIDEQIAKGLDRKVWLPSGGSLIIDRTEAMTVVDVNTGKFTGSGGNLEETVTKNNLEAAEEIVRQLRLRDIGGIIVVDFIDMVLESNRDLVLRRMVECLGRDRTRHQVAEVTSLGLVQMTRKRIGTGLLEAFSEECTHCKGRGLTLHDHPIEPSSRRQEDDEPRRGGRRGRGRGRDGNGNGQGGNGESGRGGQAPAHHHRPTPAEFAAMARSDAGDKPAVAADAETPGSEETSDASESLEVVTTEATLDVEIVVDDAGPEDVDGDDKDGGAGPTDVEPPAPVDAADSSVPAEVTETDASTAPRETETSEAEPVAPATPAVVTSTRRRTARRAAGPPARTEPEAPVEAPVGEQTETETDPIEEDQDAEESSEGSVLHVPVKRKGVRKR